MGSSDEKRGAEAFESYYRQLFGERWPSLRAAMVAPAHPPYELTTAADRPYYIDASSVLVASVAGPARNRHVLDLCAAPGGKTLVLALSCSGDCSIVANDRSAARRNRLRRVLDEHLEAGVRRSVTVTGHDARRWGLHEAEVYDLVLADVPCSSEAHLLSGSGRIDQWSRSRVDRVSADQFAILRSASQAVKPGGLVIYATCSLPRAENEALVERALERSRKKGPYLTVLEPNQAEMRHLAENMNLHVVPSEIGYRIWPDENNGAGPMYFCLLRRGGRNDDDRHH